MKWLDEKFCTFRAAAGFCAPTSDRGVLDFAAVDARQALTVVGGLGFAENPSAGGCLPPLVRPPIFGGPGPDSPIFRRLRHPPLARQKFLRVTGGHFEAPLLVRAERVPSLPGFACLGRSPTYHADSSPFAQTPKFGR